MPACVRFDRSLSSASSSPPRAGIHPSRWSVPDKLPGWVPAFAGMTIVCERRRSNDLHSGTRPASHSAASACPSLLARYRSASSAAMQPMPAAVTAWRKSSFSQRGDRRHLVDTAEPLPTPASRPPTSWANRDRRSLCDERLAVGPILGRIAESREDQGPQRLAVSRRADRRGVVTGPVGCQPPRLNFGAKADRPKYLLGRPPLCHPLGPCWISMLLRAGPPPSGVKWCASPTA